MRVLGDGYYLNYMGGLAQSLGGTQELLSFLAVVFNIALIVGYEVNEYGDFKIIIFNPYYRENGYGIWTGLIVSINLHYIRYEYTAVL